MNEDIKKFEELVKNDPEIQQKLQAAASSYTGEASDEKEIFEKVVLPVANEAGLSATYEEYKEYMSSFLTGEGELSEDELTQIAGGKTSGSGAGATACYFIGVGAGANYNESHDKEAGGLCLLIGFGFGNTACMGEGEASNELDAY